MIRVQGTRAGGVPVQSEGGGVWPSCMERSNAS